MDSKEDGSVIRNLAELVDHGTERARRDLLDVATAAIEAVHPDRTVPAVVEREGTALRVGDRTFDLDRVGDVYVVGAGKGSVDVVEAVLDVLGEYVDDGVVAEKRGQERPLDGIEVLGAGHPIPDDSSLEAGRTILDVAEKAGADDLVFACVTGGASAQCVVPAEGLSLSDLRETTAVLLEAGLPIEEVNAVRKHLSAVKGGRLARHAAPASVATLVVVDEVAGEPWGPTVGDETTFDDALSVLERHGLLEAVPAAAREHLRRGAASELLETPRPADLEDVDAFAVVLADAVDACEAARDRATELGYAATILSTSIEGESREVATVFAGIAEEIRTHDRPIEPPCVVVSGGETTVTLSDDAGEGGPNQEFALAFARGIAGVSDVTALALGTDGTDGPTDVAGALVDGTTVPRIEAAGLDPWEHLRRHDSSRPLRTVDDVVYTGPTGTNVMDLRLVLVSD